MLATRHRTTVRGRGPMLGLVLLLLLVVLAACGGAKEAPISTQAPPRRGGVDIETQVQDVIAQVLGVPAANVTAAADLRKDLGADSTQMQALAATLESTFDIQLSPEEVSSLTTVGSVAELVKSKQ